MKKPIMTLASLACLAACISLSTTASANDNKRSHKHGPGFERHGLNFEKTLKDLDLNLSDEQKLEIRAIAQKTRENNSVYSGEKQEIRLQMRDLMNMPTWDAQFAREIISSQMENGKQLRLNKAQAKHEVYQVLTREQKEALASKAEQKDERKAKGKKRKGDKRAAKMEARLNKALNLSDEQKSQWAEIKANSKALKESFRGVMQAHKAQMKQVIQADSFNTDAFLALQDSFAETLLEHRVQMAQSKYASLALLNDKQKQKMEKIKNKMKEKRRS